MGVLLGELTLMEGMVGPLLWSGSRSPRDIERSLGFHQGRLNEGYFILLLNEPVAPADIQFEGTSLRSGGRMGLPAQDWSKDKLRARVHDTMDAETIASWRARLGAENTRLLGPERWCKIRPVVPHTDQMSPRDEYPPGGGGGQWTLTSSYGFCIGAFVDRKGLAHTPDFTARVDEGAPYDQRARLMRYLQTVQGKSGGRTRART